MYLVQSVIIAQMGPFMTEAVVTVIFSRLTLLVTIRSFIDCSCPKNSSSGIQLPCDPFSGQCACPPNTVGLHCDMCANGTWDLDIDVGCKVPMNNVMYSHGVVHSCKMISSIKVLINNANS